MIFNYFANSIWQVPLLAVCCWCALRLMRASAQARYTLWIATLLLCVALPLRGSFARPEATVTAVTGEAVPIAAGSGDVARLPFYAVTISPRTQKALVSLYLGLTAWMLLRLLGSYWSQRRLLARSCALTVEQASLVTAFGAAPDRILLMPPECATPMAAGIWRPRILLPPTLLASDADTLAAVLAHESAHLRRRDTLVNLTLRLVATPIAYHPAAMLIQRQVQHARELLCDAAAAHSLSSAEAYAQALLRLAQQIFLANEPVPRSSVGLFQRTSKPLLEERIMNLIAPPAPLRAGSRWLRVLAGTTLFGAAAATASLVHFTPAVMAASVQPVQTVAVPAPADVPTVTCAQRKAENMISCEQEEANAASTLHSARFRKQVTAPMYPNGSNPAEMQKELSDLDKKMKSPDKGDAVFQVEMMDFMRFRAEKDPAFRKRVLQLRSASLAKEPQQVASAAEVPPAPASPQQAPVARVSGGVMAGQILTKVQPVYPPDAKEAHITGAVVMHAIIGKDGAISSLEVVSGPEELRASAIEAVHQWVYKPYLLNGQPTEVDTTITVNYSMG